MSALGPGAIRALNRPGVIVAVAAFRLLTGACLAYPIAALVASSGIGQRVEGDRLLFEAGGYWLLELARLEGAAMIGAARGLMPMFALGVLLTVLCNGVLLTALSDGATRGSALVSRALVRLPTLAIIGLLTGLAQGALLLLASIGAELLPSSATKPIATTAGHVALWLLALTAAGAVGGASDLAKAASVRAEAGIGAALTSARRSVVSRPLAACFGWLPYGAILVVLVLAAAEVAERIDVSAPGGWRVLLVFGLHQLVIVASVALRAAWYARALRLVVSGPHP